MQKSPIATPNLPKRPRQPRKPKAEHLGMVYPKSPDTEHPAFWLAAYLQDLAQTAALDRLCDLSMASRSLGLMNDNVSQLALFGARRVKTDETRESAGRARDDGMLLYAWPGTKFFDSVKLQ